VGDGRDPATPRTFRGNVSEPDPKDRYVEAETMIHDAGRELRGDEGCGIKLSERKRGMTRREALTSSRGL
jgi:hypothetical protein